ncbi:hypothetical protein INR49_018563, partial [Caranx melampygus]
MCVPQAECELDQQSVQNQLFVMCVSRCLLCVGVSLIPMAIICMVSNILLLIPELNIHFLLEGHVTREATWATGLWGSGFLVLLGARAFVQTSKTRGCCAFRSQSLRVSVQQDLWSGVCLQPHAVVEWNVVLFSVMGGASALQTLICAANILNSLLGLILGQGFCHNK